ncbi:MAG: DUF1634 domain-containing protein [Candidatus Binataceae bacterium]
MAGTVRILMAAIPQQPRRDDEEDRLLRRWTPALLRTILIVAVVLLGVGLAGSLTVSPGHYAARFHELQRGIRLRQPEDLSELLAGALAGNSHAICTLGLMVLTLVPIGRVAFTLFVFLMEKDRAYVAMTAYVLTALIVGAMLGRIG